MTEDHVRQFVAMPLGEGFTAEEYTDAGLPWFDYYSDGKALPSSGLLGSLASMAAKMISKGKSPLQDNKPVHPKIIKLTSEPQPVRDGEF